MTESHKPRSSILMLVDGLRPDMLGPYGNTWFDTNSVNELASESLLFETCISDTPDFPAGLAGIFRGQHSAAPALAGPELVDIVDGTGAESILISSQPQKFADAWNSFDRLVDVPVPEARKLAPDLAQTQMAVFFAAAIDTIRHIDAPTILILDCPGFVSAWDAPWEYRSGLSDSEDPVPSEIVVPPDFQFNAAADDPDSLLDCRFAYGGQVQLFDLLLGIFREQLAGCSWAREALFCLTATRGFPLGEHGVIGFHRRILYNEAIRVPLLIRWPDPLTVFGRSQQLVQPGSLYQLISDWHGGSTEQPASGLNASFAFAGISTTHLLPSPLESLVISRCSGSAGDSHSIQTHAWKYISGPTRHLFVKPDDPWEFNDVCSLCPAIASELEIVLQRAMDSIRQGKTTVIELVDQLGFGIE